MIRTSLGALIAVAVALAARKAGSLTTSGTIAAAVVGTLTVVAGWAWAILLLLMFVPATGLSKMGETRKSELVGSVVEKHGRRDAWQVLANGGVYMASAVGSLVFPSQVWYAVASGALAASAADTWATEIGTLVGGEPVSIITGKPVPRGTSGGVTMLGSLAAVGGALFIALAVTLTRWPVHFAAAALGGIVGALADSLLGATLQSRRWCERCAQSTEREVHACNTRTVHAAGISGFGNDAVNAVCSCVGALIGLMVA
ncbi:MAG: DUF92 domain-containing protein [Gemmatimonadaceae bacterium]